MVHGPLPSAPLVEHRELSVNGHIVHLVGSIPGFVPDGQEVQALLERLQPVVVALGIPPEDLPALRVLAESEDPSSLIPAPSAATYEVGAGAPGLEGIHNIDGPEMEEDDEGFASLDPLQSRLLGLLERFGDVRLPSPDLEAAFRWATAQGVAVTALDLDDEAHAEVFVRSNRMWDVFRNQRLQPKLLRAEFKDAEDAGSLVRAFDAMQTKIPSLRVVEEARESHMARRLQAEASGPTVAIVPLARFDGVLSALS